MASKKEKIDTVRFLVKGPPQPCRITFQIYSDCRARKKRYQPIKLDSIDAINTQIRAPCFHGNGPRQFH